jgi:hypothetical protein
LPSSPDAANAPSGNSLTNTGLRQADPISLPCGGIDPHWLREQYQSRQRSLKDIAAQTGIPVDALAATARDTGIPVRHGINGRAHPLASLGEPGTFPPAVWNAFARPQAEQRIRRLSPFPGTPASTTPPATSASSTPSWPAKSDNSKTSPAPRSCAQQKTGPLP